MERFLHPREGGPCLVLLKACRVGRVAQVVYAVLHGVTLGAGSHTIGDR